MIRKLLSLTIALALLLMPCLALAEDYQSYAAGDGSLSFFYPEGWLLLSRENIDSVLDIASELEGMADLVETARAQIEQTGVIVLIDETGLNNINLQIQDVGMTLSGDMLLELEPTLQSSISASLSGVSFYDPEIVEINGTETLLMQYAYTMAGFDFSVVQAYMPVGTKLAVATLTCSSEERLSPGVEALGVILGALQAS